MKHLLLASTIFLLATPALAQDTYAPMPYGFPKALESMGCTGSAIAHAFRGDFSAWVLPNFIPGNHLRAGQYIDPELNATGDRRCAVKGAPNGPLS